MQIIHAGGVSTLVALIAAHRAMTGRPAASHAAAGTPTNLSRPPLRRRDCTQPSRPGGRVAVAASGPGASPLRAETLYSAPQAG